MRILKQNKIGYQGLLQVILLGAGDHMLAKSLDANLLVANHSGLAKRDSKNGTSFESMANLLKKATDCVEKKQKSVLKEMLFYCS